MQTEPILHILSNIIKSYFFFQKEPSQKIHILENNKNTYICSSILQLLKSYLQAKCKSAYICTHQNNLLILTWPWLEAGLMYALKKISALQYSSDYILNTNFLSFSTHIFSDKSKTHSLHSALTDFMTSCLIKLW